MSTILLDNIKFTASNAGNVLYINNKKYTYVNRKPKNEFEIKIGKNIRETKLNTFYVTGYYSPEKL